MDDAEVIAAFLESGATSAFGPTVHVEGETLKIDGWWAASFRISDRTFILRDEPAPSISTALEELATAFTARGLTAVGSDLPGITLLTYTNIDLGYAPWVLWSTDRGVGEADLNAKATEESFLGGGGGGDGGPEPEFDVPPETSAYVRGARRLAGAPTRLIVTIGVNDDRVADVVDGLGDCRVESHDFGEIGADEIGSLLPNLVLVDAAGAPGRALIVALQASPAVSASVVAITAEGGMLVGADATIGAADPPDRWMTLLRDLLP